jgi:hypothetical protein
MSDDHTSIFSSHEIEEKVADQYAGVNNEAGRDSFTTSLKIRNPQRIRVVSSGKGNPMPPSTRSVKRPR